MGENAGPMEQLTVLQKDSAMVNGEVVAEEIAEVVSPQFGARPIKRVIQRNLLNELSKMILDNRVTKEQEIVVDEKGGALVFSNS